MEAVNKKGNVSGGLRAVAIVTVLTVVLFLALKPKKQSASMISNADDKLEDSKAKEPASNNNDEAPKPVDNAGTSGADGVHQAEAEAPKTIKVSPAKAKAQGNLEKIKKRIAGMEEMITLGYSGVDKTALKNLKNEYALQSAKVSLMN